MILLLVAWYLNSRSDAWFEQRGWSPERCDRVDRVLAWLAVLAGVFFLTGLAGLGYSFAQLVSVATTGDVAAVALWTTSTWWSLLLSILALVL